MPMLKPRGEHHQHYHRDQEERPRRPLMERTHATWREVLEIEAVKMDNPNYRTYWHNIHVAAFGGRSYNGRVYTARDIPNQLARIALT